ncbi:MAG: ParA family partition ATPase [Kiloniellales bacterium]
MAARIITIAQQKGGAGKTTLAAHLAVAMSAGRRSVALVDIDPQQSLTQWYRLREARLGANGAGLRLSQISGWRVQAEVERLAAAHDVLLIDSPPHAETEAKIAIRCADLVVVPVQPSPMDVWATRPTLALAQQEKVPALLVLNRVPPRANLTGEMLAALAELGAGLANTRIGNRIAFASALAEGRGVAEVQPGGQATVEIRALARELLRRAA